jgi:uncharacterized lipoprotein NlpE involved in copper resistance
MKKHTLKFLTALVIAPLMGCGNSQQNSQKDSKTYIVVRLKYLGLS